MTKMMIRGGDLDLVEYDFSPFSIGENIRTCGMDERKYSIEPKPGKHTVKVPARVHLCVLDMNRFSPSL